MRPIRLTLSMLLLAFWHMAGSGPALADHQVEQVARRLADRADHVWRAAQSRLEERYYQGHRGEDAMRLYLALNNFASSASLYRRFADGFRRENLRGGAKRLIDQAREIDGLFEHTGIFGHLRDDWRKAQREVATLANLFNLRYGHGFIGDDEHGEHDDHGGHTGSGRLRWWGRVDDSDYISLRRDQLSIRHLRGREIRDSSYQLSAPLPRRPAIVQLRKLDGRGRVRIVQQPSIQNDYTAVVLIEDKKSGDDRYEFELVW